MPLAQSLAGRRELRIAGGQGLNEHLADAELVVYNREGRLETMRHWQEILRALTG